MMLANCSARRFTSFIRPSPSLVGTADGTILGMTNASGTKTRPFRVHLPPQLYDTLTARAAAAGVSMSQWIKDAIHARLEREG